MTTTAYEQEQSQEQPQTAIDRAIANHDIKALFSEPCLRELVDMDRANYFATEQRIKAAFKKDVNLNELRKSVKEQRESLQPWTDDGNGKKAAVSRVAGIWAAQNSSTWAYDRKCQAWRRWNGKWWEEQVSTGKLDLEAERILTEFGVDINGVGTLNTFHRFAMAHLSREFERSQKVNFINGTLIIEDGKAKLRPHRCEDELTSCLPYAYDKSGKHPNIDAYMLGAVPDALARRACMTHIGLALLKDTSMHNTLFLLGVPRAGKSTMMALMNAACGIIKHHSFAGSSLLGSDLEGKRSRATWSKKPIVCADELPADAIRKGEETLKNMSAHSGAESRGINKDEDGENEWLPKLVLASNDTPQLKDNAGGLRQRLIFIEFPYQLPDEAQDKLLLDNKMLPELGAFAATCIQEALLTLHSGKYPISEKMRKKLDSIAATSNPLKAFLEERTVTEDGAKVSNDRLHAAYEEDCRKNGNKPLAKSSMCRAIEDMHLPGVECNVLVRDKKLVPQGGGKTGYVTESVVGRGFKGLRLLTKDEVLKRLEEEEQAEL